MTPKSSDVSAGNAALAQDYNYLRDDAIRGVSASGGTKTISSGAITVAPSNGEGYYLVAAQTGTTDDLDSASGGAAGDQIVLQADTGDVITITAGSGSGEFLIDKDIRLTGNLQVEFRHNGTGWVMIGGVGGADATPDTGAFANLTNSYATVVSAPASGTKKVEQIIFNNQSSTTTEFYFKILKSAVTYFEFYVALAQYETFVFEFPIYLDSTMSIQAKTADSISTGTFYAAVYASANGVTAVDNFTGTSWDTCLTVSGTYVLEGIAVMNSYTASHDISWRVYDGVSAVKFTETRALSPGGVYMAEMKFVMANAYTVDFAHGAASYTGTCMVSYQEL